MKVFPPLVPYKLSCHSGAFHLSGRPGGEEIEWMCRYGKVSNCVDKMFVYVKACASYFMMAPNVFPSVECPTCFGTSKMKSSGRFGLKEHHLHLAHDGVIGTMFESSIHHRSAFVDVLQLQTAIFVEPILYACHSFVLVHVAVYIIIEEIV